MIPCKFWQLFKSFYNLLNLLCSFQQDIFSKMWCILNKKKLSSHQVIEVGRSTVDPWTRFELCQTTYRWIFFSKYNGPFLSSGFPSMGFTSADSTEDWKLFSHFHLHIPNCPRQILFSMSGILNLQVQRANCRVKSYMWIFDCGGLELLISALF